MSNKLQDPDKARRASRRDPLKAAIGLGGAVADGKAMAFASGPAITEVQN